MRPVNIKNKYTDNLAHQRHARFLFRISMALAATLVAGGGVFYLLFFRNLLDIETITLNGLNTAGSDEFRAGINERLERKYLGLIPRKNNLFLLNTSGLRSEILAKYPILESLEIRKAMPHELIFNFKERKALGVWCFDNIPSGRDECFYFDSSGDTWGPAARSTGFLIFSVEDQRNLEAPKIDGEYFNAIKKLTDKNAKLPVTVKDITIQEKSYRDLRVNVSAGYSLLLSLDSDISAQIEALKIFLANQDKDFKPQYLDLRVDGRVYYK